MLSVQLPRNAVGYRTAQDCMRSAVEGRTDNMHVTSSAFFCTCILVQHSTVLHARDELITCMLSVQPCAVDAVGYSTVPYGEWSSTWRLQEVELTLCIISLHMYSMLSIRLLHTVLYGTVLCFTISSCIYRKLNWQHACYQFVLYVQYCAVRYPIATPESWADHMHVVSSTS